MLTDFENSFTGRFTGKFATNSHVDVPPLSPFISVLGHSD